MSKASKVINIFIFVFAIVVVVFGVLLFQKREQITQARSDIADKMCNQIPGITHTKTLLSLNAQYNYDAAKAYGME